MSTNGTSAISGQIAQLRFPAQEQSAGQYRGKLFRENIDLLAGRLEHYRIENEYQEFSNIVWVSLKYPEPPIAAWASQIDALLQQQDEPDEGIYSVQALSQETADAAKSLLQHFPFNTSEPAISATAQGELDFDWRTEEGAMLTISVGPEGDVAFAFTDGDSEHAGREFRANVSPDAVRFYLQRITR